MTDKMVFPRKLKEGSQVRVIAPSSPFNQVDLSQRKTIERVLKELGLTGIELSHHGEFLT